MNSPRMTGPTLKVLGQVIEAPLEGLSGAEISKATGIASGTLYPILFRLEKAGWLESAWENVDASEIGRPRKRLYRMTSVGAREARAALSDILQGFGGIAWQS
jgi:PadR family transcriptional regulator, regulatory protein PadR